MVCSAKCKLVGGNSDNVRAVPRLDCSALQLEDERRTIQTRG